MNVESTANCSHRFQIVGLPGGGSVGMLVVKQSYDLGPAGCVLSPRQEEVFQSERLIDGRLYRDDLVYPKEGVDLVVIGDCVAPGGGKVLSLPVSIRLGSLHVEYLVSGDRHWTSDEEKRQDLSLEELLDELDEKGTHPAMSLPDPESFPQPPAEGADAGSDEDENQQEEEEAKTFHMTNSVPFSRMPLDWKHAYGGKSNYQVSWQDNPDGKGFVQEATGENQETDPGGVPLPNVEYADQLITSWKDQPRVAGCGYYPMLWGLRMRAGIHVREMKPPCILKTMFNQAHPDLVLDTFPTGQELTLTNMTQPSPLKVAIPSPSVAAELESDGNRTSLAIEWDLVCVAVERKRLNLVGRALFKYNPESEFSQTLRLSPLSGA